MTVVEVLRSDPEKWWTVEEICARKQAAASHWSVGSAGGVCTALQKMATYGKVEARRVGQDNGIGAFEWRIVA